MKVFLFFLLALPLLVTAQDKDSLVKWRKVSESKIMELTQKLEKLQEAVDRERTISDKTFNSISNQLSASSNSLTLFGILFGVLAIGLGIYVTYIERKIVIIREKNIDLLNQTQNVKNEVVEINRLIQSDISGLYKKIKKEETSHILDRLMNVPKDISNLLQELLSRDLEKADFDKLKIGYQKLLPSDSWYSEKYKMLFFQHFSELALKDATTKEAFIKYIPTGIECSFENDILKSTNDIFQYFIDEGLVNNKEALNIYFNGLNKSKFKDFKKLYGLIFQKLSQRDKQFLLAQLVESNLGTEDAKINYGTQLIDSYSGTESSESEKIVFNEINVLREQKVEREEKIRLEKEQAAKLLANVQKNKANN